MDFFIKDYRFTALLGSLKNILMSKNSQKTMFNENGTVSYNKICNMISIELRTNIYFFCTRTSYLCISTLSTAF